MELDDTIVAIATPPGRGGIGVVRLSGPQAREIALPMLRLKHELEPARAVFGEVVEIEQSPTAELRSAGQPGAAVPTRAGLARAAVATKTLLTQPQRMDEVVVTYFAKPHSYTTDDVVEISAHGSPVVLRRIVEMCVESGARLAEPGEFTARAFLHGRMDLTQAEAVRDLIDSQTLYQAKVAAQQLGGALSRRLQAPKQKLVELIALLEAGIDFAEDDVSVMADERIRTAIASVRAPLDELAATFSFGKIVHEGLTLAIVGRPNVGKSSLFNRLVERDRAIVTATPGTTRDLVSETVAIGGIPVKLVDTAGIRPTTDLIESIGIQKSREAMAEADVVLVVTDASQDRTEEDKSLIQQTEGRKAILVANKCDLAEIPQTKVSKSPLLAKDARNGAPAEMGRPAEWVSTSAVTGEGVDRLRAAILRHAGGENAADMESGFVTNARQQGQVRDALAGLGAAAAAVNNKVPHEMLLLDLYSALRGLDGVTGATTTDDILNLIFSTFCIGK